MDDNKTKDAIVVRGFTDAGTGASFTASDKPQPIPETAFGNYEAAGLVREPTDEERAAAKPSASTDEKPASKPAKGS